jgi:hypothetical protein
MKINSLYKDYIQKSRIFLYPLLGIRRHNSVTPIQTYMHWNPHYNYSDCKFIMQYHARTDNEFKVFEDVKLFNNPLFHNFYELEDDTNAYVFDFSDKYEKDFMSVVNGKYSELSPAVKKAILNFFKGQASHHVYIESYLHPEKYFPMYADILNVDINNLKYAGELCDKPDLTKEMLELQIKNQSIKIIP